MALSFTARPLVLVPMQIGSNNHGVRFVPKTSTSGLPCMVFCRSSPAMLAAKPAPTGSETFTNTIGIVRVSCARAAVTGVVLQKIATGASATNAKSCDVRYDWHFPSALLNAQRQHLDPSRP